MFAIFRRNIYIINIYLKTKTIFYLFFSCFILLIFKVLSTYKLIKFLLTSCLGVIFRFWQDVLRNCRCFMSTHHINYIFKMNSNSKDHLKVGRKCEHYSDWLIYNCEWKWKILLISPKTNLLKLPRSFRISQLFLIEEFSLF